MDIIKQTDLLTMGAGETLYLYLKLNKMKILTVYTMAFQRNGVAGTPFYTALIKYKDGNKVIDNFLLTFETEDDDKGIRIESCRGVHLSDCNSAWRGDEIGYMMVDYLKEYHPEMETIYDAMESLNIKHYQQ